MAAARLKKMLTLIMTLSLCPRFSSPPSVAGRGIACFQSYRTVPLGMRRKSKVREDRSVTTAQAPHRQHVMCRSQTYLCMYAHPGGKRTRISSPPLSGCVRTSSRSAPKQTPRIRPALASMLSMCGRM
jgi:hypothetical protein